MPIAFMGLADCWNAFKASAPTVPPDYKIKRCKDKGKPIIILPIGCGDDEVFHITAQADADNDFACFHITDEDADIFESGAKKGKKYIKGGKKKYYDFTVTSSVPRTVSFSAAGSVYNHDTSKSDRVVSDTIKTGPERQILGIMSAFILHAWT